MVKPSPKLFLTLAHSEYPAEMLPKKNSPKSLLVFYFLGLLLSLSGEEKAPPPSPETPPLDLQTSNTQLWCDWAKTAINQGASSQIEPLIALEQLRKALKIFRASAAEVALKNPRHFADVQVLEGFERDFLYLQSEWLVDHSSDKNKLSELYQQMLAVSSPAEDQIQLLMALQNTTVYLEQLQKVFRLLEKAPEQLKRTLAMPPIFFKVESWSAADCHRGLEILDIAFKQHWRPKTEDLDLCLLPIAKRYESLHLPRFALDLLMISPLHQRSPKLSNEIERYDALWQKQKKQDSEGVLY